MRRRRALRGAAPAAAGALTAVLAALAVVVPAPPGAAASQGGCDGVVVVVDATALGGEVTVACAPGEPANGFEVLTAAGFAVDQVVAMPGFVCRIDGSPDSTCQRTPDADAYWAYWHGDPDGDWESSQLGAADHDPVPGRVEGWAFGATAAPSIPPPHATDVPSEARAPGVAGAAEPATDTTPRLSPLPTMAGLLLVIALAIAAMGVAVHRRASADGADQPAPTDDRS